MCGIAGYFKKELEKNALISCLHKMNQSQIHRGPNSTNSYINPDNNLGLIMCRLSILDLKLGMQPMTSKDGRYTIVFNGTILNSPELRKELEQKNVKFFTNNSDTEVLLQLLINYGIEKLDKLNGSFAFAFYDNHKKKVICARDRFGLAPFYYTWKNNEFLFASELKALEGTCSKIELFPPGHYMSSKDGKFVQWYKRDWREYAAVKENETSIATIKEALEAAVHRQLMSDVPYGVLLSGGLDSSVVSAIAKKYAQKRVESGDKTDAWYPQTHSFAVGLEGSPDLAAAQVVADHIGTVHHEIKFTIQEGLDAIKDVIYNIETYDITTIRSSTPMYLMARVIKSMGIKMVLSGEGADEIFGGYLYFHKAPNAQEFHQETVRKLDKLHMYDCLRANKSLAAWGIEGRVPFLDKEFIDVAMRINPQDKMINGERMEKWVIRKAFEDMLPESVAWRQKEQFSDGVGYSWIDTLKEVVDKEISDEQLANAKFRFPIQTPQNKEEFYYRSIFEGHFPSDAAALSVPQEASVACSTAIALEWDEAFKNMNEPSGRAILNVHDKAYE